MEQKLVIHIDRYAELAVIEEIGSMNKFYDRLSDLVSSHSQGNARVEKASSSLGMEALRGGDLVQIVAMASSLIAALAPIVIEWLRDRRLNVEETTETRADGSTIKSLKVSRGS